MTLNEIKKDAAQRLRKSRISFDKITAKTINFLGLGYFKMAIVTIHSKGTPKNWGRAFNGNQKSSGAGYFVRFPIRHCADSHPKKGDHEESIPNDCRNKEDLS